MARAHGQHIHCDERSREETGVQALKEKLKRAGKTLTSDAWQMLEEKLGGSLTLMDRSIDQLILYSEGSAIDPASVEKVVGEFLKYDPFDLTNALLEKDTAKALAIFHFFYELSQDMTSTIGLIHWQLKRIWQAKMMMKTGATQQEITRSLRISPYRASAFLNQVRRFQLERIEELIESLWRMDWQSKTGALNESIAMEMFLARV